MLNFGDEIFVVIISTGQQDLVEIYKVVAVGKNSESMSY